ncbi:MAG: hypothetical protein CM1200mP41_01730 [Gammaproteobacteria bacterium]|nr:MAG: hypothetical protein CM1200mP41_01730 [Gammaproteobacteria bacterium]
MTINYEVIVTCAVTGAGDTVDKHPAIPVTPEQVASAAIEAADAGAAIVHIHVRDPETGAGSRDIELFRQSVEQVRASGRDVLINLTAGMGGDLIVDDDDPATPGRAVILLMQRLEWLMLKHFDLISLVLTAAASTSAMTMSFTCKLPTCFAPWPLDTGKLA